MTRVSGSGNRRCCRHRCRHRCRHCRLTTCRMIWHRQLSSSTISRLFQHPLVNQCQSSGRRASSTSKTFSFLSFFFPLWNRFFSFFPLLFILSFHLISRWHFIVANDQMNPVSMSGASVVGVEGFPPPIPSPPPPLCTPLITIISTIQSKRNHRSFEFIFRI